MKTEGTIINVMFDAARGTVSTASRETETGKPIGALPKPTRKGYTFVGWYLGDQPVSDSFVPTSTEDVTLVAHWEKRAKDQKMTSLRKQKIAVAVLTIVALLMVGTLLLVNHIVTIYPVVDEYQAEDGSIGEHTYYLRKKNGIYGMYRKDGSALEQNSDGYYLADSGNQYSVNAETGEWALFAAVDYDPSKGEQLVHNVNRVLMFAQIRQNDIYSIKVTNEHGTYHFYRNESGKVQIEGFEDSMVQYDGELYAALCVSCGYTLSKEKLDLTSPEVPRLADGSVDLSAYGLAETVDADGNVVSPAVFTVTKARMEGGKYSPDESVTYTVKVGDATPSKSGYYAMLEGRDNAIYVLDPMLEEAALQPIEALVTPRVSYPMSMMAAARLYNFELIRFDSFLGTDNMEDGNPYPIVMFSYAELESRENTFFTITPYVTQMKLMEGYAIHDETVSDTAMNFYNMEILRCVELGLTEQKLIEYGLDKNVHWLSFDCLVDNSSDSLITNSMVISQKTEQGTYYVASYLYDMIVEVDQYYFSFLELEEKDWYEQYFIAQDIAYVDYMKMEINGKTYEFKLDNSLTYTYYIADNGTPTLVNLNKGSLQKNKTDGRYGFLPTGANKVYEIYYVDFEKGTFKLNASNQTVYMVGNKEMVLEADASNMFVYCPQYNNPNNPDNPHLLDYKIQHNFVNDKGQPMTEYINAIDNFRRFWIQDWYWLSLEGDVDPDDFQTLTGMTVDDYIAAKGNDCYATITVDVEDMAKSLNHYTYKDENGNTVKLYDENNSRYLIYRFYRYSERKAMVTVELVTEFDAQGNPISDPTNVLGRFYVLCSYLDMMGEDLEKVINEERVKRDD